MERYEISAITSKVYEWKEAKELMLKGKVMCGEWIGNGPPDFYKIDKGKLLYTNDFEDGWIPEKEKVPNLKKFEWYRARIARPIRKVQPYHVRTKVYQRLKNSKPGDIITITYNPHMTMYETTATLTYSRKELRIDKQSIEYDLRGKLQKVNGDVVSDSRMLLTEWVTDLKITKAKVTRC